MRKKSKSPRPWLKQRLDELKPLGKTAKGLADELGVASSRISEMIKGGRDIYANELEPMATYLGWNPEELRKRNDGLLRQSTTSGKGSLTNKDKELTPGPREVEEDMNKEILDFVDKASEWPPEMRAKLVKMVNLIAPEPSEMKRKRKRHPR